MESTNVARIPIKVQWRRSQIMAHRCRLQVVSGIGIAHGEWASGLSNPRETIETPKIPIPTKKIFLILLTCFFGSLARLTDDTHGGKGAQATWSESALMAWDAALCRTQIEFPPRVALAY